MPLLKNLLYQNEVLLKEMKWQEDLLLSVLFEFHLIYLLPKNIIKQVISQKKKNYKNVKNLLLRLARKIQQNYLKALPFYRYRPNIEHNHLKSYKIEQLLLLQQNDRLILIFLLNSLFVKLFLEAPTKKNYK